MPAATHPDAATLTAFGLGRLPAAERAGVEAHVADCPDCCRALERVAPDSLVGLAQAAMTTPGPAAATVPTDVPAALVDHPRYRVLSKLGAGGMGVVYKAEHRVMGRPVALKVLNPAMTAHPDAAERFRREVRLASRLGHQHIVTAHDADEAGGLHFLVMEYVEGLSLDRFVAKKGPLPVATACQFIRQAALGLQHAFEKGMVHRDIKPHNLMVTKKGVIKVLDFGLAQLAAPDARAASETTPGMTAPGMVVGTPDFVAPEQARASAGLDHRADIYSLGCTLFYLLTGRPPFPGGTAIEKLIAHVHEAAPPLAADRPDVPEALAAVLARMMAKKPDHRYQTPAEVATALLPFARAGGPPSGKNQAATVAFEAESVAPPVTPALPSRSVATPVADTGAVVRAAARVRPAVEPEPTPEDRPARKRKKARKKSSVFADHPGVVAGVVAAVVALPLLGWGLPKLLGPREKAVAVAPPATGQGKPPAEAVKPPAKAEPKPPAVTPPPSPRPVPAVAAGDRYVYVVLSPREVHYPEFQTVEAALREAGVQARLVGLTRDPVRAVAPPALPGGGGGGPGSGPGGRPMAGGPGPNGPAGRPQGQAAAAEPDLKPEFTVDQVTEAAWDGAAGVVFVGGGGMGREVMQAYQPDQPAGQRLSRVIARMLERGQMVAGFGPGTQVLRGNGVPTARAIYGDPPDDPTGDIFKGRIVAALAK